MSGGCVPRSLVWATALDVLSEDHIVTRREDYLVVRSPSRPDFWWGNLLLFDEPPAAGDGSRWEELFAAEFADEPRVRHRTFAWDRVDGTLGAAAEEFVARGYELEQSVGLVAPAGGVRSHPRANREITVRALDPNADEALWDAVVEVQVADRDDHFAEDAYRAFSRAGMESRRALFRAGRGAWYVALDPDTREVAGTCGIVVTDGRGRFQDVVTAAAHRRRGVSSRLLADAAAHSAAAYDVRSFVIAADVSYHALGLYESLGFARQELVCGVCLPPD